MFLHGILGSGANWRSFARRLVEALPGFGAVLVDLPNHGQSQHAVAPFTINSSAYQVLDLVDSLSEPVPIILAHSFGGKVALEAMQITNERVFDQAWILDSTPGPRPDARGSELTLQVVSLLKALKFPLSNKKDFYEPLLAGGLSEPIVAWLAMNLKAHDNGYIYRVNLDSISAMLDDYFARDLWPILENPPSDVETHLVLGERSDVFSDDAKKRTLACAEANPDRVFHHVIANAGHWVHVDQPDALYELLLAGIKRHAI